MEAVFSRMGDVVVVSFVGRLDVEKAKSLNMNQGSFHAGKVIFKLDRMSFVGSSGLQIFFQTLAEIQIQNRMARVIGVKPEFIQLIKFSKIANLTIDISIEQAYGQLNGEIAIVDSPVVSNVSEIVAAEESDLTDSCFDDPSEAA